MGATTGISWTHATFNPWWGCSAVSPACDHCYAEAQAARFGTLWGVDAPRREFGDRHWNEPRRWNARAARSGEVLRVFTASMADVFDKNAPAGARERLWALIRETPSLTWLVLTKRIGNAVRMLPPDWGGGYPNVQLGITAANQEELIGDTPKILQTPARRRFLSLEPLLGPVDTVLLPRPGVSWDVLTGEYCDDPAGVRKTTAVIDWVIVGGESGRGARPMDLQWARAIRDRCRTAGTAFFFKQIGGERDKLGKLEDLPADLRVRQFPPPPKGA